MSRLSAVQSPFCRQKEVIELLRSERLMLRCVAAGWLPVVVRERKLVLFRREDVLGVIARIDAGELPPRLPKKHNKDD